MQYSIHGSPLVAIKGKPLAGSPMVFELGDYPSDPNVARLTQDACKLVNERFPYNSYVRYYAYGSGKNQAFRGSNPYRRWALERAIRDLAGDEFQLLNPHLGGLALSCGTLPDEKLPPANTAISPTYDDLAIVIYSFEGRNGQLARHLVSQLRKKGIKTAAPLVIYGLETVEDSNFPNWLRLDIGDRTVTYPAPILNRKITGFDASDPGLIETGFPHGMGDGKTYLHTLPWGLRRVVSYWGFALYATDDDLTSSTELGRMHFVKGANPQSLEAAIKAIDAERTARQ